MTPLPPPNQRRTLLRCAVLLLLLPLGACVTYAPPERTNDGLPLPGAYTLYDAAGEQVGRWWETMNSPELNALVEEALAGNFTIAQAVARFRQAAAVAVQSRAPLYPSIGFAGDAGVSRRRVDAGESASAYGVATQRLGALNSLLGSYGGAAAAGAAGAQAAVRNAQTRTGAIESLLAAPPSSAQRIDTENHALGLTAGYEVDLWGRIRAGSEAARNNLEATREDVHAAMHSIAGQVALTWVDLLESMQLLEVLRDQLETNETTLGLIELRYRNGLATALDLYQQRQAAAESTAAIPPVEAQAQVLRHTLAILLGKPPRSGLDMEEAAFPEMAPLPSLGLPADLLSQRPDVRAAGLRLRAADWQVSAARADRLPRLDLSAGARYEADALDLLFENWIASLAASVTGPLFDGHRRKAEVARTRAVVEERLAAYKLAVVNAVGEVEDALVRIDRQAVYMDALNKQYEAARNTHREALGRYRKGLTDYLPVLTALRNTQALERAVISAEHDLIVFRVQLHLALGGRWMQRAFPEHEDSEA